METNSSSWTVWGEIYSVSLRVFCNLHHSRTTCYCKRLDIVPNLGWTNIFFGVVLFFPYPFYLQFYDRLLILSLTCQVEVWDIIWFILHLFISRINSQHWRILLHISTTYSGDQLRWSLLCDQLQRLAPGFGNSDEDHLNDQLREQPPLMTNTNIQLKRLTPTMIIFAWQPLQVTNSNDQLGRPTPTTNFVSPVTNSNDQLDRSYTRRKTKTKKLECQKCF